MELGKNERQELLDRVVSTVEAKHFDPHFDKERWRTAVKEQQAELLDAPGTAFAAALSDLVRSFGTPDAGFFHESSRRKAPKGLASRFQYCQPSECAPAHTQPTDAG